jgi:CRP/FNR family transcriptional regulator
MERRLARIATCDSVGPIGCRSCDLHEICRLTGLLAFDAGRSRQSTGALRPVRAGEPLFRAGDPAHHLYAVRQGMLKSVHVSPDGDQQIVAYHTPGDVLGLESFSEGRHANDVIALQPVVCCELPMRRIADQVEHGGEFGSALIRLLSRAIAPRLNPARGSIRGRVTNFLLDFDARLTSRGLDGGQFALGLSRQDIADLLNTRIETVSRVIQQLNREGAIRVRGNQVRLLSLAPEPAR